MSKAIMLSIQPKWCELIASGKKTIEVRKSRPSIETPFKVYIYQTKKKWIYRLLEKLGLYQGKVIGEFVCDKVDEFHEWQLEPNGKFQEEEQADLDLFLKHSCLSFGEVCAYRENLPYYKPLYGWHISDLKIYDKPKELGEFKRQNPCYKAGSIDEIGCWEKCCVRQELGECDGQYSNITRPPQSWCYVRR